MEDSVGWWYIPGLDAKDKWLLGGPYAKEDTCRHIVFAQIVAVLCLGMQVWRSSGLLSRRFSCAGLLIFLVFMCELFFAIASLFADAVVTIVALAGFFYSLLWARHAAPCRWLLLPGHPILKAWFSTRTANLDVGLLRPADLGKEGFSEEFLRRLKTLLVEIDGTGGGYPSVRLLREKKVCVRDWLVLHVHDLYRNFLPILGMQAEDRKAMEMVCGPTELLEYLQRPSSAVAGKRFLLFLQLERDDLKKFLRLQSTRSSKKGGGNGDPEDRYQALVSWVENVVLKLSSTGGIRRGSAAEEGSSSSAARPTAAEADDGAPDDAYRVFEGRFLVPSGPISMSLPLEMDLERHLLLAGLFTEGQPEDTVPAYWNVISRSAIAYWSGASGLENWIVGSLGNSLPWYTIWGTMCVGFMLLSVQALFEGRYVQDAIRGPVDGQNYLPLLLAGLLLYVRNLVGSVWVLLIDLLYREMYEGKYWTIRKTFNLLLAQGVKPFRAKDGVKAILFRRAQQVVWGKWLNLRVGLGLIVCLTIQLGALLTMFHWYAGFRGSAAEMYNYPIAFFYLVIMMAAALPLRYKFYWLPLNLSNQLDVAAMAEENDTMETCSSDSNSTWMQTLFDIALRILLCLLIASLLLGQSHKCWNRLFTASS